jgi:ADP-ribose pyrophosphatase YjhB (NUDIX family)
MGIRVAGLLRVNNSILMVEHIKNGKTYWLLPGGGVNIGEEVKTALQRELKEELNLKCGVNDLLFVVESLSARGDHIIQPTYRIEAENINEIELGVDKRVAAFDFFDRNKMASIVIYPDIKDELREYLNNEKISKKYFIKKWID